MKKLIIAGLGIFFGLTLLQSCVKDKFDFPEQCTDQFPEIEKLVNEGQLAKASIQYVKNNLIGLIDTNLYIEGIVIADDKSGNYFKEMVFQDETGGIAILIDKNSFFVDFPIGRKVYIKLNGLRLQSVSGVIKLGLSDSFGSQIRIPNALVPNYILKGPCRQEITPQVATINGLNASMINTLVKIEDVEFTLNNVGPNTFADGQNQLTQNRTLLDCNNNEIVVRTSGFAEFASSPLPTGNGPIVAVYSVFGTTKQLFIRDLNDVAEMIGNRCGENPDDTLRGTTRFHLDDILIASGATTIIEQDFEGTSGSGSIAITGWTSFSQIGTVSWTLDNFSGNKYARISGFNSGSPDIITWLVSPAFDMSATSNEVFSCRVQSSFDDGATLQVLYSTDYSGSGSPANATWTNLNATIPQGPASGFGTFQNVGPINMPTINSSTVYLAFRYLGGA